MNHCLRLALSANILLFSTAYVSAGSYEPLIDFKAGKVFYTFKNNDSSADLSTSTDSSLPNPSTAKLVYKFAGSAAYVGIGADFANVGGAMDKWQKAEQEGALTLYCRSSIPLDVQAVLISEGSSYGIGFKVEKEWAKVILPFKSFVDGDKTPFNPAKNRMKKIEIRPSHAGKDETLELGEIGIEGNIGFVPDDKYFKVGGEVTDSSGRPVTDAIVEVFNDRADRYGWYSMKSVRTGADGRFSTDFITHEGKKYISTKLKESPAEKPVEDPKAEKVFYVEWDFNEPVKFDQMNIVNAGINGKPEQNTRNLKVMIRSKGEKGWKPLKEIKDNKDNTIKIMLETPSEAEACRLEISKGSQEGQPDVARLCEVEFLFEGKNIPMSGFDFEKYFLKVKNLKANNFKDAENNPELMFDGKTSTLWCSEIKGGSPVGQYVKSYLLEIVKSGYKTISLPVDLSKSGQFADMKIKLEPVTEKTAEVTVDTSKVLREINPLIYGGNVALWHSDDFKNPEVISATKEAGFTILRYPGGGRSQEAYWQRQEAIWCSEPLSGSKDNNCVMTPVKVKEFIEFCRKVGAEPMITLNHRVLDMDNLADFYKFLNVENDFKVKYFEIGNEPEGYVKTWGFGENWRNDKESFRKTYQKAADLHKQITDMLKKSDPTVLTMGPVTANENFYDNAIPPFWEKVGKSLDILAVHRYPQCDLRPGDGYFTDTKLLRAPLEWKDIGEKLKKMNEFCSPGKRPLYAVTEWNTAYHSPSQRQQQIVGALYMAFNLCEMISNGIDIANIWVATGCGEYNVFNTARKGKIEKPWPFYVFKILSNNFRGQLVSAETKAGENPDLFSFAAKNGNTMNIAFVNTSPDTAYKCKLDIQGMKVKASTELVMERSEPYKETPVNSSDLTIPAYSLVLVKFVPVE